MEQIEKERFFTMAETYDAMAQTLVPMYDMLQNEIFNIVPFDKHQKITVIDLGAGSGILLEKILSLYPNSTGYWIDFSDAFLDAAKDRLHKFNDRVSYILSPLEDDWQIQLKRRPDLITSVSAIHHLEHEGKIALYNKSYNLLNNNGWFINIDEMKTLTQEAYKNSLVYWVKFVDNAREGITDELMDYYNKWKNHFDNWRVRNIENIDTPKIKGDDLHESFLNQIRWLQEAGFKNVDVFVKYHLWCLIVGIGIGDVATEVTDSSNLKVILLLKQLT